MQNRKLVERFRYCRAVKQLTVGLAIGLILAAAACKPLRDWRERLRERSWTQELASLEPIDAHTHIGNSGPAFIAMLERLHMS
jgi:hypothetical protein